MPSGATVMPSAAPVSHTFNFTMTAPTTPGTYTTDWQMVHEGIRWFGATLTRSVNVVAPVPGFSNLSANQTITYGTAAVTLSGRLGATGPIYPAIGESSFP